jgi:hypothetical protein
LAGRQEGCSGKTGVIGFCMCGDYALMMAPRPGFSAASVNYGGAMKKVERGLPDVCPIVGSYVARDRWPGMRKVPHRLERLLTEGGVEHDIKVYPEAGHGFMNDHDPAELPVWIKGIAKLARAEYHEPSAQGARLRIVDFFDTTSNERGEGGRAFQASDGRAAPRSRCSNARKGAGSRVTLRRLLWTRSRRPPAVRAGSRIALTERACRPPRRPRLEFVQTGCLLRVIGDARISRMGGVSGGSAKFASAPSNPTHQPVDLLLLAVDPCLQRAVVPHLLLQLVEQ